MDAEFADDKDGKSSKSRGQAKEHKEQLERLRQKDPDFYEFLKEHDKELLQFEDEDIEEEIDDDLEEEETEVDVVDDELKDGDDDETSDLEVAEKEEKPSKRVITATMVDEWCNSVRKDGKISAIRTLMKAFHTACHYGDDSGDDPSSKFSIMSSSVFNKVMLFVLSEMDGILRKMLKLPSSGGKKEIILELRSTKQWTNYNHIVKSYLGNALHVLNQMTDTQMIAFTLRRLKYSSVFLAAFPSLLRKYIKIALHFWGTGGGALPVVSFLFLRDLCIRLGSDCIDECFKGIYKAYVLNCQFVNAAKLQHIQFLQNCIIELFGVDLPTAYQHAFIFIRQLAMVLREALNTRTKEAFRKVYEWKFMSCLELWTGCICTYGKESDLKPLAYPLSQIIAGVARLVPTARYFPLRLRCARMLNQIASATDTFIPVSMLLLDMLEMKELNRPPTGGIGKAVDLRTILKVSKPIVKTRAFQEACVFSVIDELSEHLAQWSYSVSFFELSFIPAVRLRNFTKSTKVDRFRKAMRQLIRQIEANSVFTNEKRMSISYMPNSPAVTSFLEDEKKAGASPLSQFVLILRQRAQQRNNSLMESSVVVGENSSFFGNKNKTTDSDDDEEDHTRNEEGTVVFSSSWLPGTDSKDEKPKESKKKRKKKRKTEQLDDDQLAVDEDVVQDLVLSSDEDDSSIDGHGRSNEEDEDGKPPLPPKQQTKKHKQSTHASKNKKFHANKSRKRKRPSSNKGD
ncbi:nucleolar complex-associated protein 2 [Humulus lupulus]|uniref:nucleolar complex-associated protein 2 n=1 Tax=Humulus lupulus TaxID=3486 RepID=UPI002B412703|nr:nucleolar complex-associated protein 2 [Humulus lupulus]XP_062083884.1 nucleolar complex-associated protein 2 [Humulus lupulus]